jgi:hypothetical protein
MPNEFKVIAKIVIAKHIAPGSLCDLQQPLSHRAIVLARVLEVKRHFKFVQLVGLITFFKGYLVFKGSIESFDEPDFAQDDE